MHTLASRQRGRSSTPALVLAALAVAALLALAARALGRSRRRARRRALLSVPPERPAEPPGPPARARPDVYAVDELRERPRVVGEAEAARILGLGPEELASLNMPVTRAPDGGIVYDSWEIVHWAERAGTGGSGRE